MDNYLTHLLQLLPRDPGLAKSAEELCNVWPGEKPISVKTARSYLKKSLTDKDTKDPTKLAIAIQPEKGGVLKPVKYYRNPAYASGPASIGHVQEARKALSSIASHLGKHTEERVQQLTLLVTGQPEVQKRLAKGIRFTADWIGREPAEIAPGVLEDCVKALGHQNVLRIEVHDRHDKRKIKRHDVRPRGLVIKDSTVYMLAADSQDKLTAYALHRVLVASILHESFPDDADFNLDTYIRETHGFSFPVDGDLTPQTLVLEVAPETIYHFRERPLPNQAPIGAANPETGWFTVTAEVPFTVLLVPFLLSMGHWIRVVAPDAVANEMARRSHLTAKHYTARQAAHPSPFAAEHFHGFSPGHEA